MYVCSMYVHIYACLSVCVFVYVCLCVSVEGIEAESVMLGQVISMVLPPVGGYQITVFLHICLSQHLSVSLYVCVCRCRRY